MIDFKPVNNLMNKQMTRQEFLKHMGAVLLGVVGIGAFLRNLADPMKKHGAKAISNPSAYGVGRAYGK